MRKYFFAAAVIDVWGGVSIVIQSVLLKMSVGIMAILGCASNGTLLR
jgi:hypothetical protein